MAGAMLISCVFRVVISPPVSGVHTIDNGKERAIQINVLNSIGQPGIASKAKEYLRRRGFDVVEVGNYDSPLKKSMIIDRTGEMKATINVAYALGINDSLVKQEIDSTLFLQSTIILGDDFTSLKPFN